MNILGNAKFPALTFGERFISDFFRAFVNTLPCSYPGCRNEPSDAHHPVHKSAGNSAGDEITIPLCRIHHSKWISVEKFEAETGLKINDVIRSVWQRFIRHTESDFTGEPKASPRGKKVAQKAKSDFATRCSKLTDEEFHQAGIWLQETMKRIREGRIGKVEERKLKEYLKG